MSDVLSWIRLPGPFLVGHRGFPAAARENTPPAFEAALEAGCDGVELDVRLTRDGVAVVHHDESAEGPEGRALIAETDWSDLELRRFEAGGAGYRVSSLPEVLAALSGRALVNVEVKPPLTGQRERTAMAVLAALRRVRPRESVLVSSFDPGVLAAIADRDRSILLGFLFASLDDLGRLEQEPLVDALTSIHPRHELVDSRLMKRARERNLAVHAWTVDEIAEARRLAGLGVTAIITNRPDLDFGFLPAEEPEA